MRDKIIRRPGNVVHWVTRRNGVFCVEQNLRVYSVNETAVNRSFDDIHTTYTLMDSEKNIEQDVEPMSVFDSLRPAERRAQILNDRVANESACEG